MDCYSELWCLATVDGKECKESFDTYEDFEEHFCQKHLDLALFGCGARGCTAQFGTALQIFRHLETCKRRGKKIKLLQYSGSALESLTALDRAKLLAMQCSVQRAKRENELTTISGSVTTQRSEASNVQRLHIVDGMSFPSSLNDDQIHVSIIESPELCQVEDVGSEPYPVRRERIITPARQAAWRLKEQMLLEQEMKKKNKPPEKTGKDTQNKQKKLPVKITDKTRISALINDDPERKRTLGHPLTMESSLSRNSGFGTVNSNMFFESTKHILCTESRTKLRPTEIQHRSAIQKQPKAFESNLPAGPNNPPKIGDVSRPQSSSLDYIITRPPDYSGFLRNPATNPTLYDIPLPMFSPIQASCDRQNNFETNRTLTKTSLLSQPATFSTSEIAVQQKRSFMKLPGILRKKKRLQNVVETVEQNGQMDLNVLSLFSKRFRECKKLEHAEVSTIQAEQLEQSTERTKSIKSNVRFEKEVSPVELSKKSSGNVNVIDLSPDKNYGEDDNQHGEAIPILLNLFSDEERAAPVLFDPRIMPGSPTPDQSRSDRRSIEEKLLRKREWKCAETLVAMTQRGVGKEGIIDRNLENPVHRNKVAINCDKEVETEVPTDHRPCGRD